MTAGFSFQRATKPAVIDRRYSGKMLRMQRTQFFKVLQFFIKPPKTRSVRYGLEARVLRHLKKCSLVPRHQRKGLRDVWNLESVYPNVAVLRSCLVDIHAPSAQAPGL